MNLIILFTLVLLAFSAYDQALGQKLCKATVASYCKPQSVKDWTCKPCMSSPIKLSEVQPFYNSTGHVLGIIGVSLDPLTIVLIFRGTLPWVIENDIIDNDRVKVDFPPCPNGCRVHRGLFKAYMELSSQVLKATQSYMEKYATKKIIVTGHSLGGALATHAAIDLIYHGMKIQHLYTFGSFRVGDTKFSEWFSNLIEGTQAYRITHGRDPIPHMPSQQFEFVHVTSQIFYPGLFHQQYVTCKDKGGKQDPYCSDKRRLNPMVNDHVNYYGIDFIGIITECL